MPIRFDNSGNRSARSADTFQLDAYEFQEIMRDRLAPYAEERERHRRLLQEQAKQEWERYQQGLRASVASLRSGGEKAGTRTSQEAAPEPLPAAEQVPDAAQSMVTMDLSPRADVRPGVAEWSRGLSQTQAATYTGLSVPALLGLVKAGKIHQPFRIGRKRLFDRHLLDQDLDRLFGHKRCAEIDLDAEFGLSK